ncbi:MAG: hypothetical protein QOH35_4731 [Acidobacteriaceae bacterium]|jgi:hypothetical protein|nr:hypothetical protein [Acidobacteriaceae bacterium]MEA2257814.1 hypothetical protein [Acidobacteriaceae bacterium]MEA2543365.1 hypothetical protein [Acidobacteriaceae bacterium]
MRLLREMKREFLIGVFREIFRSDVLRAIAAGK